MGKQAQTVADAKELIATLERLGKEAAEAIAAAETVQELDAVRAQHLAKKGPLQQVMRRMGGLSGEDRPKVGKVANEVRDRITEALESRRGALGSAELEARLAGEGLDITLPGTQRAVGSLHPLTKTMNEVADIFRAMGFAVADGPEIEDDWHNFEALNIPADHPARDMHDTLYIRGAERLLRTHTSPVQIREMQRRQPPLAIICPGRVFRRDQIDQTHSPMFHQVEGLLVDRHVTFGDLKGVLEKFIHTFFGPDIPVRFRPSYFPFTEPSAEVDMMRRSRRVVDGKSVEVDEWTEMLGCGMVDPAVFKAVGYDPEEWTGFAFGMGVERLAMIRHGIGDIRHFFENDLRFLAQL